MQKVFHQYRNKSRIFDMLDNLYAYVSDHEYQFEDILWLDDGFKPVCDILDSQLIIFRMPTIKDWAFPEISHKKCDTFNEREIIVCLSGGKDSAACAKYYVDRGYKVHLYHATGINKAYGDEKKAAEKIAKHLGCDLFVDKLWANGRKDFIEHPLKNYMIADGAIHYALAMNYPVRIAFGNFNQAHLTDNEFEVCGGDCVEMWDAYQSIIKRVIPDFEMQLPLATNADTFGILESDWELFNLSVSCMSPFRFREHWKHRSEELYNTRLLDNRCGCCWKCCMESMWLMDYDYVPFNELYYRHCFHILELTVRKETGAKAGSTQEVWDYYMFYPIEKSKMCDYILTKKVHGRGDESINRDARGGKSGTI